MEELFCAQCGVWKPKESVTFATVEEAEQHVLDYHPGRLLAAYQGHVVHTTFRRFAVEVMMKDRNAP